MPKNPLSRPLSQDFRRYRLALGLLALGAICFGILWLGSSGAVGAFADPPQVRERATGDPAACYAAIDSLVREIVEAPGDLATARNLDPARTRLEFAQGWRARWQRAGVICDFDHTSHRGAGSLWEILAHVHSSLPMLHRSYAILVEGYLANADQRVDEVRQALATARRLLADGAQPMGGTPAAW